MTHLVAQNLSMRFGGLAALEDVSFEVRRGEILGLIGPNGAGKTTLFNVINGFLKPSQGRVMFKGADLAGLRPSRICALGIGRTFQIVKPLRRMSVLDNVVVAAFLRARDRAAAEAVALETLAFCGLEADRHLVSDGLPLGKRKRLELARALATGPELVLLDEAFAGLNPTELNESVRIVQRIRERGTSMMIIEHRMRVIMSLSDRVVVLNYGQKLAEGSPEVIGRNPLVISAYLGDAEYA